MLSTPQKSEPVTDRKYTDWDEFDPEVYAANNYSSHILPEDRYIIKRVIQALHHHHAVPGEWRRIADIGTGPNCYPAMLLAPFVRAPQAGGKIDLIEYGAANRRYLNDVMKGLHEHSKPGSCWDRFEKAMKSECAIWKGVFDDVRQKASIVTGSIYDLPQEYYDAVSSYFVSESITDDWNTCKKAVDQLLGSVKSGGFITVAFMLGSEGYNTAGVGKLFPAVPIHISQVQDMFRERADVDVAQVPVRPGMRAGYAGVALVCGRKR